MARSASRFDRKKPSFRQQARVLVICEDTKSSLIYLQDAARYFRSYAQVEIAHCGKNDPLNIVKEAIERRRNCDKVYCAIDRDRQTRSPYIGVGNHSAGDLVVKTLRDQDDMQGYDKGDSKNLFDKLIPRLPVARQHAVQVLHAATHENALNPSTQIHELMDLFEQLGTLQPLD
ncbi:MAG: RloB domain-containing protein [Polaromonas sp.]|nr:MAG: RloB domain-containing protein [Polaromonas sp.]